MSELNRIKKEFEVYGKTLHNVIHDYGVAADYIEILESQLKKYKRAAEYGLQLAEFYGDGNSHYDAKYEWGKTHNPEIGQETVPSGEFARSLKPKIVELLK